jgi:hypothetical protein
LKKIDIVLVDVEGFDLKVLKLIEIKKYRPFLIKYEHKHFGDKKSES